MTAPAVSRVRMPRATCKLPQPCALCTVRIKGGQRMGLDFQTREWCHLGCLVRKINATRSSLVA